MKSVPQQFAVTRDPMIDALGSERRLIDELIGLMRRQRAAVGADDLQGVEETVYAVQRVLCTLGEARKRRRALNVRVGRGEDLGLCELEEALGATFTPHVREAREELERAVQTLSGEVAVNRRLLREALAVGDEDVGTLLAGAMPQPLYTENESAERSVGCAAPRPAGLMRRRHSEGVVGRRGAISPYELGVLSNAPTGQVPARDTSRSRVHASD